MSTVKGEITATFDQPNRHKKSVALDLTTREGRDIAHRIIASADIFISNFRMAALKKLEMDYDTLAKLNPRLIYGLGTGWGLAGPDRDLPAFDFTVFARSGLMASMGDPDAPPPSAAAALGDHPAAMTLAYGIMLALYHRDKTGEGQLVHVSLLGNLLDTGALYLHSVLQSGEDVRRVSRKAANNPLWNSYRTKDGRWLQLGMLHTDLYWADFCTALESDALRDDARFLSHEGRIANNIALIALLDSAFAERSLEEWSARFHGLNVIWSYVNAFSHVAQDPQVRANNYIVKVDHPATGEFEVVGLPVQLSKTPGDARGIAPELGQHTEEVLLNLGFNWDEICALKQKKVIC